MCTLDVCVSCVSISKLMHIRLVRADILIIDTDTDTCTDTDKVNRSGARAKEKEMGNELCKIGNNGYITIVRR